MQKSSGTWFQKIENMHPYQTLMYLGMFGSGLIFTFMTLAFLLSGVGNMDGIGFRMPKAFIGSTFILLISGYSVSKMMLHFREEEISKLKNSLLATFLSGLLFTVLQFIGWKELTAMGIDFTGLPRGSFLYVLSGIHVFHLLVAMVFALIMLVQYSRKEKDQIQHLILLTNPFEKMRIHLFTTYWHFMDLIWIVLFFTFVLAF